MKSKLASDIFYRFELTAHAPLMLGLIGMLAAGEFLISWLSRSSST